MLGNPIVYRMVVLLAQRGPLTPAELANMTGRSVQTVSGHLATLRVGDIVRYETAERADSILAQASKADARPPGCLKKSREG